MSRVQIIVSDDNPYPVRIALPTPAAQFVALLHRYAVEYGDTLRDIVAAGWALVAILPASAERWRELLLELVEAAAARLLSRA